MSRSSIEIPLKFLWSLNIKPEVINCLAMNKKILQSETPVQEPLPPFPLPPTPEDERIPVPPSDIIPEPINLPPEEPNKSPIEEGKNKEKAYL